MTPLTDAARQLVTDHLSVAKRLAAGFGRTCRHLRRHLSVDDLYGEACLYLCELARRHPADVPFEGLAVVHVRRRLTDLVRRVTKRTRPHFSLRDVDRVTAEDVGWDLERDDWICYAVEKLVGAQKVAALARLTRAGCTEREASQLADTSVRNAGRGFSAAVQTLYEITVS